MALADSVLGSRDMAILKKLSKILGQIFKIAVSQGPSVESKNGQRHSIPR
jgi:hypothetical protein